MKDSREIQQFETDLKTLHDAKAVLVTSDPLYEEQVKSVNEEVHRCEAMRSFYKKQTKQREEEIARFNADLSKEGGPRQLSALFKSKAVAAQRIAEELQKA